MESTNLVLQEYIQKKGLSIILVPYSPPSNGVEEWEKNPKVWGCLVKVEVPIPKKIKIGPKTVDYRIKLEQSSEGSKIPWKEPKDNLLNKEIQRCSKYKRTSTSFGYDFVIFPMLFLGTSFWKLYHFDTQISRVISCEDIM